jgi:hypothetical protein
MSDKNPDEWVEYIGMFDSSVIYKNMRFNYERVEARLKNLDYALIVVELARVSLNKMGFLPRAYLAKRLGIERHVLEYKLGFFVDIGWVRVDSSGSGRMCKICPTHCDEYKIFDKVIRKTIAEAKAEADESKIAFLEKYKDSDEKK